MINEMQAATKDLVIDDIGANKPAADSSDYLALVSNRAFSKPAYAATIPYMHRAPAAALSQ
jgi:hypothetical protein